MKLSKLRFLCIPIIILFFIGCNILTPKKSELKPSLESEPFSSDTTLKIGAIYFNGWYSPVETNWHMLKGSMGEPSAWLDREPIWGWVTSSPEIVREQIDLAADAGLKFFSFCWYFSDKLSDDVPLNEALKNYLNAPNKSRLKFNLMLANHDSGELDPQNWQVLKKQWINYFRDPNYLTIDEQPLLVIFNMPQMITKFGGEENVKKTFDVLRAQVRDLKVGHKGVKFAACIWPTEGNVKTAMKCGFDFVTAYNDHVYGLRTGKSPVPIDNMKIEETKIWNMVKSQGAKILPTSTLNWDVRPWSENPDKEPIFYGYSQQSVYNSVRNLKEWILNNPDAVPVEKIGFLYAWNEYGEGGWLTPSVQKGDSLLVGLKQALDK